MRIDNDSAAHFGELLQDNQNRSGVHEVIFFVFGGLADKDELFEMVYIESACALLHALDLFQFVETAEEGWELIQEFYRAKAEQTS